MGYFSNGSEGMDYEERYCRKCIHFGPEEGPGCPVWGAHLAFNYQVCNDPPESPGKGILDALIPMSEDGLSNLQCKMFVELVREPDPAGARLDGF